MASTPYYEEWKQNATYSQKFMNVSVVFSLSSNKTKHSKSRKMVRNSGVVLSKTGPRNSNSGSRKGVTIPRQK